MVKGSQSLEQVPAEIDKKVFIYMAVKLFCRRMKAAKGDGYNVTGKWNM